jgi:hypothetical protein
MPNQTLIVNPGSVGLPAYSDDTPNYHRMESYAPDTSYVIVGRRGASGRSSITSSLTTRSAQFDRCVLGDVWTGPIG